MINLSLFSCLNGRMAGVTFTLYYSCEIVALQENVDRPESYDSFSAKSCAFLAHGLALISPFPYTTWRKARYQIIPKAFTYYSLIITNFTKLYFPSLRDQTSRDRIWQMIRENSSVGLAKLLWTMSDICKVSNSTKVVGWRATILQLIVLFLIYF
jgi:hypothetical protein